MLVKYKFTLLLFIMLNTSLSLADNNIPIYITSTSANYRHDTSLITYNNDVRLDQGTTHLTAHTLISTLDQNHKLSKANAIGNKESQAHYWDTKNKGPLFHAHANTIKYLPQLNKIILLGNAKILQGNNSYQAHEIEYNLLTKKIISPKHPKQKITIIYDIE